MGNNTSGKGKKPEDLRSSSSSKINSMKNEDQRRRRGNTTFASSDSPESTKPSYSAISRLRSYSSKMPRVLGQKQETQNTNSSSSSTSHFLVRVKDFELYDIIGIGAFGKVIMAKRKHTNRTYAMKIVSKQPLVEQKKKRKEDVVIEKAVLVALGSHPFIISLYYCLQSTTHVFLFLDYIQGISIVKLIVGDFKEWTSFSWDNPAAKLPEKKGKIYFAELVLALEALHRLHFVYRDLKPDNVLVRVDGHICLIDLGGAAKIEMEEHDSIAQSASVDTTVIKDQINSVASASEPVLSHENEKESVKQEEDDEKKKEQSNKQTGTQNNESPKKVRFQRRKSIIGGFGWKAPEMVKKEGYLFAVDWWGLGLLSFLLLNGFQAFSKDSTAPKLPKMNEALSSEAKSFLTSLLSPDETSRLGSTNPDALSLGSSELKKHPFFEDIDWDAVYRKEVEAPHNPVEIPPAPQTDKPVFKNYSDALKNCVQADASLGIDFALGSQEAPWQKKHQYLFDDWDYCEPTLYEEEKRLKKSTKTALDEPVDQASTSNGQGSNQPSVESGERHEEENRLQGKEEGPAESQPETNQSF